MVWWHQVPVEICCARYFSTFYILINARSCLGSKAYYKAEESHLIDEKEDSSDEDCGDKQKDDITSKSKANKENINKLSQKEEITQ